jgi:LysM repeat protein
MHRKPSSRHHIAAWLGLPILALVLTGCFQSAGESVQPTPVSLTSIATLNNGFTNDQPTAFVTPLPAGGFVLPTDDPNSFLTQAPANNAVFPTQDNASFSPTDIPVIPVQDQPTLPVETAPVILPTPTGLPTEGPCVHTVQPGEWFLAIARKYNVELADLLAVNPRSNPDALQPGEVLKIPGCDAPQNAGIAGVTPTPTPPSLLPAQPTLGPATTIPSPIPLSGRVYTVAEGDTLGSIARKWGVSVQALKDANALTSDLLHVGDQLKIPKP